MALEHYQQGAIFDNLNLPHLPYFHARGWPARAMPSLTAEFLCPILALPLSVSSLFAICCPDRSQPAPPLPSAGSKWLLYVNPLISKAKMGSFGQIWAQPQTPNDAQFCTILPNRAQLGP
jgi:hypothetical protein